MSQLSPLSKNKMVLPLAVLASLVIIQLLCFAPIVSHVGFYLDDWATLSFLHFAPKAGGYLGLLQYYLMNDSRVLIRPLEVLHFGSLYYLCGDKPLGYHLLNLFFEVVSAFLLFKIVARLSFRSAPALLAALLLLLYPSHDSTRYWVICSSVALSLLLYLGSLQAAIVGTDKILDGDKKQALLWQSLSFTLFLLSLLNYEIFLPLAAVTVLTCALLIYRTRADFKALLLPVTYSAAPLILAAVALLAWLKLVPLFGHGYAHALSLEPAVMFGTIWGGLVLTAPPASWQFFSAQAANALAVLTTTEKLRLVGIVLTALVVALWLARRDQLSAPPAVPSPSESPSKSPLQSSKSVALKAIDLLGLGLLTIFLSYTIFGLSRDYMPTYITLVNRVNTGASVGVALILAALIQACAGGKGESRDRFYISASLNPYTFIVALTTIFFAQSFYSGRLGAGQALDRQLDYPKRSA